MIFLAYLCGLLAATGNAAANVLQRAANRSEDADREFSWQLVTDLLHKPVWFAGIGCMAASFCLQAAGLGLGSLAAVEPLLVLELPLTLVASRLWLGGRLDRRAWLSIIVMSAATIGLIAALGPTKGKTSGISWFTYAIALAVTVTALAVFYGLGRRTTNPAHRAAILGVGTGTGYGLAASLMKGMTGQFSSGGFAGVFTAWQLYAGVAAGVFAVWMNQNAVGAGRLVIAQPGVTLTDPCISVAWGAAVYSESIRGGLWIIPELAAAVIMTLAAVALSKASDTSGPAAEGEQRADRTSDDDNSRPARSGRHRPDSPECEKQLAEPTPAMGIDR